MALCSCKTTLPAMLLVVVSTSAVCAHTGILQTSDRMDITSICLNNYDSGGTPLADYSVAPNGNNNPYTPVTIHAIKFDNASNLNLTNHYIDPTASTTDDVSANKILLLNHSVPEPSGMLSLIAGLMGLLGLMSRKRH